MQRLSAFQEMHHFDFSSPSSSSCVTTSYTCPLPSLGKQLRKQSLCRIVPPLPALLLAVPVMRGLRNYADSPEQQQQQEHRSNWKPYGTSDRSRGGRGGRGGRDQYEQQRGGDESGDGFRERQRFRGGFGAGAANLWRNSQIEIRAGGARSGRYSGGRFRGRDGKIREENGFRREGSSERRPRYRPGTEEYRYWRSAGNELPDVDDKFVMVSYNILADKNASEHYRGLYYHIPWRLMDWERRKNKIVQELGLWSPDVMCLQEVDQFDDLREEFEKRGYQGTYKGRTGGARDGCAMFWRSTRFRLLQEENIQFNELGLKDNVAQLCALQSIGVKGNPSSDIEADLPDSGSRGNVLIVGNIHVLFNPKRGDIKLGQVRVLLDSAHALSQKWNGAPVVIGGDFNSTPASSIYQYLANSELDISSLNRQNLSGQVEAEETSAWMSVSSSVRFSRSARRNDVSQSVESRYEESLGPATEVAVAEVAVAKLDMATCTEFASCVETTTSYEECSTSGKTGSEVFLAESSTVAESETSEVVKRWYWTREEIAAASGTFDETTVRHKLRLRSVYTEIEGENGCRDPQGEPLVTTYHKKFMGTVDYIWHTEGLDTVRVLDTLPVNVLQRCQGLPSQYAPNNRKLQSQILSDKLPRGSMVSTQLKWGSDHLALACELAFHPTS